MPQTGKIRKRKVQGGGHAGGGCPHPHMQGARGGCCWPPAGRPKCVRTATDRPRIQISVGLCSSHTCGEPTQCVGAPHTSSFGVILFPHIFDEHVGPPHPAPNFRGWVCGSPTYPRFGARAGATFFWNVVGVPQLFWCETPSRQNTSSRPSIGQSITCTAGEQAYSHKAAAWARARLARAMAAMAANGADALEPRESCDRITAGAERFHVYSPEGKQLSLHTCVVEP